MTARAKMLRDESGGDSGTVIYRSVSPRPIIEARMSNVPGHDSIDNNLDRTPVLVVFSRTSKFV